MASSFTNMLTAERAIQTVIRKNRKKIREWEENANPGSRLAVEYKFFRVLGRGIYRKDNRVRPRKKVKVVLQKEDSGYSVITAYPE